MNALATEYLDEVRATPAGFGWNLTIRERLLIQVHVADSGCWEWTGQRAPNGYPKIRIDGHELGAHRVAYAAFVGPIPDGRFICHSCDNPPCIHPAHLFPGTAADNTADMYAKGRGPTGDRNGSAKLTEADVIEIRRRIALGAPSQTLADAFGVAKSTINRASNGQRWGHIR